MAIADANRSTEDISDMTPDLPNDGAETSGLSPTPTLPATAPDDGSDAGADHALLPDPKSVRFQTTEVDARDIEALTLEGRQATADRFARQMSRGLCILTVAVLGTLVLMAVVYLAFADPAQLKALWT